MIRKTTTKRTIRRTTGTKKKTAHRVTTGRKKTLTKRTTVTTGSSRLLKELSELETEAQVAKKMLTKAKGKHDRATATVLDKLIKATKKDQRTILTKLKKK